MTDCLKVLVTGGAGFIGTNLVRRLVRIAGKRVVVFDKLTYAGNPMSLGDLIETGECELVQGDVCDGCGVLRVLAEHHIGSIVHLAAESHVDRSIHGPDAFIQTNIVGTFSLLEAARSYWNDLPRDLSERFRFLHVSTDEVYGSLPTDGHPFRESNRYEPNSPYAASKAASDHLVRAYSHTYGLPVITTNCSNNYGPFQFPEKLIPLCIYNALTGRSLPIYGDGQQIRDWLYVEDHCEALLQVLSKGQPGEVYNIGGWNERTNLEVVHQLCRVLNETAPRADGRPYEEQITFVKDRPGHDRRYAVDAAKVAEELGWRPRETFESGIARTVEWYLANQKWVTQVTSGEYRRWIERHYAS